MQRPQDLTWVFIIKKKGKTLLWTPPKQHQRAGYEHLAHWKHYEELIAVFQNVLVNNQNSPGSANVSRSRLVSSRVNDDTSYWWAPHVILHLPTGEVRFFWQKTRATYRSCWQKTLHYFLYIVLRGGPLQSVNTFVPYLTKWTLDLIASLEMNVHAIFWPLNFFFIFFLLVDELYKIHVFVFFDGYPYL